MTCDPARAVSELYTRERCSLISACLPRRHVGIHSLKIGRSCRNRARIIRLGPLPSACVVSLICLTGVSRLSLSSSSSATLPATVLPLDPPNSSAGPRAVVGRRHSESLQVNGGSWRCRDKRRYVLVLSPAADDDDPIPIPVDSKPRRFDCSQEKTGNMASSSQVESVDEREHMGSLSPTSA